MHNSFPSTRTHKNPAFLAMFRAMHPGHHGSAELRFRLRFLKFMSLFMDRFEPSMATPSVTTLQRMRKRSSRQAQTSHLYRRLPAGLDVPPLTRTLALSESKSMGDGAQLSNTFQAPTDPDRVNSPSLLDSLPEFIALCAAAHIILPSTEVTDMWMRLAAGYMAQAVIEQFLIFGAQGTSVIQQAFSYGFDSDSTAEEGSDEFQINALFFGEDKQLEGWNTIRESHIRAVSVQKKLHCMVELTRYYSSYPRLLFHFRITLKR